MRVLFVSKPLAPPFHDGTKCLVRDVARNLDRAEGVVMTSRGAPPIPGVRSIAVYGAAGGFTPGIGQNARAAIWLLAASRADVWHFVFAPNAATSAVGRAAKRLRGVPVVQTIASAPRSFGRIGRLLFGDVVVAQSAYTRDRVLQAAARSGARVPRVEIVAPPVASDLVRDVEARARARRGLDVPGDAPVFVYPGDLETSAGAETVARVVNRLVERLPDAIVVFACRAKTPRAPAIQRALAARLPPRHVRFAGEISDLLGLIAGAAAVLFPVDDLWGKVDLPIVLLESMVLGVPVVALDHGPLAELGGAIKVPLGDDEQLVSAAVAMVEDAGRRATVVEAQRRAIAEDHTARVVASRYERLYESIAR